MKHPHYDGHDAPILFCRACCGIFVAVLRSRSGIDEYDPASDQRPADPARVNESAGAHEARTSTRHDAAKPETI